MAPRVPTFRAQNQLRTGPDIRLGTEGVTPAAFGGGAVARDINQSVQGLSDTISKIGFDAKKRADDLMINSAINDSIKSSNELLREFKKLQGEDLVNRDVLKEYGDSLNENLDNIGSRLKNNTQRLSYQKKKDTISNQFNQMTTNHYDSGLIVHEKNVFNSKLDNLEEDGILNHENPEKLLGNLDEIKTNIENYYLDKGASEEEIQDLVRDRSSKYHKKAIDQMVIENDETRANVYFEKFKDEMNSDDRIRAQGSLDHSNDLLASQSLVEETIKKFGTDVVAGLNYIGKKTKGDGKRRAMTENRFIQFTNIHKAAQNRAKGQNFDKYIKAAEDSFIERNQYELETFVGPKPEVIPQIVEDIVPAPVWNSFNVKEQDILRRAFAGDSVEAPNSEVEDILIMADQETEKFLKIDWHDPKWYGKFGPHQRKDFRDLQIDIVNKVKKRIQGVKSVYTNKQIINQEIKRAFPKGNLDDPKGDFKTILPSLYDQIEAISIDEQVEGRPVGAKQIREISRGVATNAKEVKEQDPTLFGNVARQSQMIFPALGLAHELYSFRKRHNKERLINEIFPKKYSNKIAGDVSTIEEIPSDILDVINESIKRQKEKRLKSGDKRPVDESDQRKILIYRALISNP